ncbi:DUF350 domain-containing protein [Paenibacillus kobensis]|uniref:DUF350 domain-containing protein n=1 Tax=Paenibacillus kobensis TaxID=59841 RepID=UPI001FE325EF|nr:DUF350 domain-containing protein [Paenibacillus kobensis]
MTFVFDVVNVLIGLVIILLIMLTGGSLFSRLTKFDDMKEIRGGNEAAGIYMGSKLLGLSIIVALVSLGSHDWWAMIGWSVVGIVVLSLVYVLFDLVTPKLDVCKEIEAGNKAVAQLLRSVIVGVSLVIGTILM